MKKYLIILLALILACSDDEIPFQSVQPLIVIEGWLTDQDTTQYVKVTELQPFNDTKSEQPVNNVTVQLINNGSIIMSYRPVGSGLFLSENTFSGEANRLYNIRVTLSDGRIIESEAERMTRVPEIDTIIYDSYQRESPDEPGLIETIYYPVIEVQDPGKQENFYRWKLYRNDTLFSDPKDIILLSDRFFDGNQFKNEFNSFDYRFGDEIGLEFMEISSNGYQFLRQVRSQTTSLGTVASVAAAPIEGNLFYLNSNQRVLGYWGVTSVRHASLKIN